MNLIAAPHLDLLEARGVSPNIWTFFYIAVHL